MWLIDVTDIGNLRLEPFLGDLPADYAILSHTWGPKETTFQEFNALQKRSISTNKSQGDEDQYPGLSKIRRAAELANQQELKYLWVDTCCINKESSAELSESINSMYLWYQKASVCYAFLSDVDGRRSLENSRWFKRGWTLQELIAPRVVEFYNSAWTHFATKEAGNSSFCRTLSNITGIDVDVLAGTTPLNKISVADKMRWAALRETKRLEDMAYCLLGLFNVNMPLLYGEGRKAFMRLQEEILKDTDDHSLFLWANAEEASSTESNQDLLWGLLAESPKAFSRLGIDHIRPLPPLHSEQSMPAVMTSRGLKMDMMLFPNASRHDEFLALLDCSVFRSQTHLVREEACILLRRISGDQFARIYASTPYGVQFFDGNKHMLEGEGETTTIHVTQKPTYVLPEITIKACYLEETPTDVPWSFSVMEAYPPDRFSTTQNVVRIDRPKSGQTVVVLRFGYSYQEALRPLADVLVGLQRIASGWEVCYDELPFQNNELDKVYKNNREVNKPLRLATLGGSGPSSHVAIYATEHERRGRHFVQLEVFGTFQHNSILPNSEPRYQTGVEDAAPTPVAFNASLSPNIPDQIGVTTRQCCYDTPLIYGLSGISSLSPDGVRTSDITSRQDALRPDMIRPNSPYAEMIKAVYENDLPKVKSLGQDKSLLECRTEEFDGFRPIHWAAISRNEKIGLNTVKALAKRKADLTSRTTSGWMAIHLAILAKNYAIVGYLFDKTLRWKSRGDYATPTGESFSHLIAAIRDVQGRDGVLNSLIMLDDDNSVSRANFRGELPLHRAAANGNGLSFIRWSRSQPSHINAIDASRRSVLFHAACGGSELMIRNLVEKGALLETTDDHGRTPIHASIMANQPQALKALLDHGGEADAPTHRYGLTPLHFACLYGRLDCVKQLLQWRTYVDVNRRTTNEVSVQPIHLAVANGHLECVRLLLLAKCNYEGRCNSYLRLRKMQEGPLHEAEMMVLPNPMTPIELAKFRRMEDIASLISSVSKAIVNGRVLE